MDSSDREHITCSDCGADFVFTMAERQFYESRDLSPPKRCKACRQARKAEKGGAKWGERPQEGRAPRGRSVEGGGERAARPSFDRGQRAQQPTFGFRGPEDYGRARNVPETHGRDMGPSVHDRGVNAPRFPGPPNRKQGGAGHARDRDRYPQQRSSGAPTDAPSPAEASHEAPQKRERPRFEITCQQCGAAATVPFRPLPGRDIFCPECYRARRGTSSPQQAGRPPRDDGEQ